MNELEKLKAECIDYINAKFSEVKPKIEVGKWYKNTCNGYSNIYCYQGKGKDHYGFDLIKNWINYYGNMYIDSSPSEQILATESEIFEALKTECLKRFKVGDRVQPNFYGNLDKIQTIKSTNFKYNSYDDSIQINGSTVCGCALIVYHKGKFANVIESKQTIESTTGNVLVFTKPIDNKLLTKIKNIL
jgi:hypothetical protein